LIAVKYKLQFKNGIIKDGKNWKYLGSQINYFLKGEITIADDFKLSQLNLNGVIEILGPNKAKMNVTIRRNIDQSDIPLYLNGKEYVA